ncbi:thioredoxin family protein [Candidatus Babeliales bacterium]|nr:thioredoxin family protein [Candidatus Babeliales bacterium]
MKQMLKTLFLVLLLPTIIVPKFKDVHNDAEFQRLMNQYQFTIVCFASAKGTEDQKEDFKNLKNRMMAASKRDDFKLLRKDVGFLMIDSGSSKTADLSHDYKISKFPTCLVFKDGKVVDSTLFAPKSTSDIINFLDKNVGDQLDTLISDRKEDARLTREENIASYYQYASSPWINPPYPWMPYGYYPYSRWGVYPYGLGWNYDC